jgi:hypothetical protein
MNINKPIDEFIKNDHDEARALFNQFRECNDRKEALKWYNQLVWQLTRHSIAEELIFYPLLREKVINGQVLADIDIEQQRQIKEDLVKLQSLDYNSAEFDQNVQVMWTDLINHMEKEENTDLKLCAQDISMEDRINAGKKFENRKLIAPTRPHTLIPDTYPTLETIMGILVAPYDKFKDLFTSFPDQKEVEKVCCSDKLGQAADQEITRT